MPIHRPLNPLPQPHQRPIPQPLPRLIAPQCPHQVRILDRLSRHIRLPPPHREQPDRPLGHKAHAHTRPQRNLPQLGKEWNSGILHGYGSSLTRWYQRIEYLLVGSKKILETYESGKAFVLHTPETNYIHVSSDLHIKELLAAPQDVLSLHALSKEMLQPKYTMDGLAVEDSMSSNGSVHMRVLAGMLKNNLDHFHAPLLSITSSVLARELHHLYSPTYPSSKPQWTKTPIFALAKSLIAAGNTLVFFGPTLSQDTAFVDAALRYPEELFLSAEILRLIPRFTIPIIAPLLKRHHQAGKQLVDRLRPIVNARLANSSSTSTPQTEKPIDCLQFFISASSTAKTPWSAHKIVQVILGVWFASVHQPALALVYALDDLCRYPEYVELLRQELCTVKEGEGGEIEELPLLDSFLKESARLHPSEAISVRRQAVTPFVFGDGLRVGRSEVVCLPLNGILRDQTRYQESEVFDGFRFIKGDGRETGKQGSGGRFCESINEYPLWGLGRHVCPGRYYATRILKIVLAHILQEYDIQFPEEHEQQRDESRYFNWRSSTIPRAESSILFRKRS